MGDRLYKLKIESTAGTITVDGVEEFTSGNKYFFLRTVSKNGAQGETMALRRDAIIRVKRSFNGKNWWDVLLRSVKQKKKKKNNSLNQASSDNKQQ